MVYYSEDYLCHHGIKGQKWGVRRFQNKDGSLTPEGRRHYGKLKESKIEKAKKERFLIGKEATLANLAAKQSKGKNSKFWKEYSEKKNRDSIERVKALQKKYGKKNIKDLKTVNGKINDHVFTGKEFAARTLIGVGGMALGVLPAAPGWPFALLLPSKTLAAKNYKVKKQDKLNLGQETKVENVLNAANKELTSFGNRIKNRRRKQ